jgi:hypothetical protein
VVTHNNKQRIIFDLRRLNQLTKPAPAFKMPTIDQAAEWITKDTLLWTVDIAKMFYHIPMAEPMKPWLCFLHPNGRVFNFNALPMGMQQAPFAATKALAPAVAQLTASGLKLLQYMDDALGVSNLHNAEKEYEAYISTLQEFGWTVSAKKCVPPTTRLNYLGFVINVANKVPTISLDARKRTGLVNQLRALLKRREALSPRILAQTLGQLVAAYPAAPTIRHHMTPAFRTLSVAVARHGWHSRQRVTLSEDTLAALATIRLGLAARLTSRVPFVPLKTPTATLTTDASTEWGWGAVLETARNCNQFQGAWQRPLILPTVAEVQAKAARAWSSRGLQMPRRLRLLAETLGVNHRQPPVPENPHITSLEATATLFGVLCSLPQLLNENLLIRSDATAVVGALIKRASPSPLLNDIIFLTRLSLQLINCQLAGVTHVPGAQNTDPDNLSRGWLPANAKLEWPINRTVPVWLWRTWFRKRPPSTLIDAFASSSNNITRRFWSYGPDPTAEAQDGLLQHWRNEELWINPPFELMERVVGKLTRDCPRRAIIITPHWPHRPWFKMLANHPHTFAARLLHPKDVLQWGPTTNLAEPLRNPKWKLVAWALDCAKSPSTINLDLSSPPPWRSSMKAALHHPASSAKRRRRVQTPSRH